MNRKFKIIASTIGLIGIAILWGSLYSFVKNGLQYIDPVAMVCYRFFLAAAILGSILVFRKKPLFKHFQYGSLLGFCLWLLFVPQTIGLGLTTASNGAFITGLFVVFVPLFSWIFGKQPSRNKIIAAAISVSGLWVLTGGMRSMNIGDALVLLGAIGFALHILFSDIFVQKDWEPDILAFQQFLVVGILSFLFAQGFGYNLLVRSPQAIWIVLFLAVFPTLVGYVVQIFAQKYVSTSRVSLILALEPVVAAVVAWTIGHEPFGILQIFGGILIVTAIIISEVGIMGLIRNETIIRKQKPKSTKRKIVKR